jgi:maltose/moltooligosaccharide transporter
MAVSGGLTSASDTVRKPDLNLLQIINMSFGFFGIQIGFALQNGNVSRIFNTLGADPDELAIYWLAGPVTGLLVQPVVGYFSDKTWTTLGSKWIYNIAGIAIALLGLYCLVSSQFWTIPFPSESSAAGGFSLSFLWYAMMVGSIGGVVLLAAMIAGFLTNAWMPGARRRPFFLTGAVLACIALSVMPNVPGLWAAVLMLWVLDASLNISMEPFRAFVGDRLSSAQRPTGFAMQTVFIGAGAVVGSLLPIITNQFFGVSNAVPDGGGIPENVKLSFYVGAGALLLALLYTIRSSGEYSPEEMDSFIDDSDFLNTDGADSEPEFKADHSFFARWGMGAIGLGAILGLAVFWLNGDKQFFILCGGLMFLGVLFTFNARTVKRSPDARGFLVDVLNDLTSMPLVMRRLAVVQFFSWFGLFIMWIYTTDAVALQAWNTSDSQSTDYQNAGDWVGVMFAVQNGVAALYAFVIAGIARRVGTRTLHAFNLLAGAAGFIGYHLFTDQTALLIPMIGLGMAWGSILALPYAILADALPVRKMGIYMGIFNFFIVLPQILVGGTMGPVLRTLENNLAPMVGGVPLLAVLFGAASFCLAAFAMSFVKVDRAS